MKKRGYVLFIILAAIIWSADGLLRRHLSSIPPTAIVLYENLIRLLIILPIVPKFVKEFKKMTKKDWLIMITIGITSGAIGRVLYTAALGKVDDISYSVVALLQQTQPFFAVGLAAYLLKEKLNCRYNIMAVIALVAAYFLTFPNFFPVFIGGNGELMAALLALGAAFVWGLGTVLSKIMLKKLSFAATAILRFIITVPVVLVLNLSLRQTYSISLITPTQWYYLTIIALTSGIASFVLYYKGLQHTEVKVSAFAEFAWPISAALFGYFLLNERLTMIQWIAGAILLIDIAFLTLNARKK